MRTVQRLLALVLIVLPIGLAVPLAFRQPQAAEYLYALLLFLHILCGAFLLSRGAEAGGKGFLLTRAPEVLFSVSTLLFLFAFIYATNANMGYVQRFMASHGNLRLAPNSAQERLTACLRFLPLLAVDAGWYVLFRVGLPDAARSGRLFRTWALPFVMLSGGLMAFSFPSFLVTGGIPALGFVCLVPLLLCLQEAPPRWGIFYGTLCGVLSMMISNYWLGTFNLLTLQLVSIVILVQYVPFMAIALAACRRGAGAAFLVFPAAWTAFDWLRSLGFLGYPWGMLGASQYAVTPLIQVASLTGVWGVTFMVMLCNSVIAWYAGGLLSRTRRGPAAAIALFAVFAAALGWAGVGFLSDGRQAGQAAGASVRLALIQQDDDPRKDDYRHTFDTLRRLTDQALPEQPDMVVWSETAFVPNIRRWSREDPESSPYAALVRDFLLYQKQAGRWLLTGNDDYSLVMRDGSEERFDYNGSVLFSPRGERVETYHKMHLVPLTESFPFKKQLPGIYALLQSFDAYLWEPGDRRVIFRHPRFSFFTPICFEDVFPDDVRRFVKAGAEVILNISNDYWSLTDTEGMQHAANAIFRAVENGRPLVRAAASGLTCLVDTQGRIVRRLPFYSPGSLVVDVPLPSPRQTLYTRWGDWFPRVLCVGLLLHLLLALARRRAGA
jgi:apolipoprotein N-acyltransferase